jgi:hypothetical protein
MGTFDLTRTQLGSNQYPVAAKEGRLGRVVCQVYDHRGCLCRAADGLYATSDGEDVNAVRYGANDEGTSAVRHRSIFRIRKGAPQRYGNAGKYRSLWVSNVHQFVACVPPEQAL